MARGKVTKKESLSIEERLEQALVPDWEQPYRVPENWVWTKLPVVCQYIKAGGDKPQNTVNAKDKQNIIPVVANGISNDGIIGFTNIATAEKDTITVSARGTIGFSVIRDYEYCPVVRLIVIKTYSNVKYKMLKYYFDNFLEEGVGSSIPQLTVPMLQTKLFPLPPLAEQQRIVDRIESLFAKLDEAKEKAQAALDSFETRKSAILHKAFTGELTQKWREENGVGLDSWEEKTLQQVCKEKITDGTHQTPTYSDKENGIPFISAKDVTSGEINWSNIKYITKDLHELLYKRVAPQIDDVLLAKNGTTGVAAMVTTNAIFDIYVTLALLRPNKNLIFPRYLYHIVNSPICKEQFNAHLTGIGVPNLHLRDIKEVSISVPSLPEQTEIVRILDSLFAKEQKAKELADIIEKIDLMKKAILTRAFRGELGTNDPNEESAMKLLTEILEAKS